MGGRQLAITETTYVCVRGSPTLRKYLFNKAQIEALEVLKFSARYW